PEDRWVQRLDSVQCAGNAPGEPNRILVRLLDRHPGEVPGICSRPLAQHSRLPVPGGRRQQHERNVVRGCGEMSEEPGAGNQTVSKNRRLDLGRTLGYRKLPDAAPGHESTLHRRDEVCTAGIWGSRLDLTFSAR